MYGLLFVPIAIGMVTNLVKNQERLAFVRIFGKETSEAKSEAMNCTRCQHQFFITDVVILLLFDDILTMYMPLGIFEKSI